MAAAPSPAHTLRRVVLCAVALLAGLLAIGFATRQDPAEIPYLRIAGSGFMFNYRISDIHYGFTAEVLKPVKAYSTLEARFEDPGGGPPFAVSETMQPRGTRYSLRSPPLRGVEKDRPYRVTVRLLQNGDGAVLFETTFTVTSQIADTVVPPAPLVIGPGYMRNPNLPPEWRTDPT